MKYFHNKKTCLWLWLAILTLFLLSFIFWLMIKSNGTENNAPAVALEERGYFKRCIIENFITGSYQGVLPPNMAKVDGLGEKEIYRSGFLNERLIPALEKMGIKTIITLSSVSEDTRKAIAKAGIIHQEFNFVSTQMTKDGIREAIIAILNSPEPILVHCQHGADRTGLVIAALKATLGEKDSSKLFSEMKTYCHLNWPRYKYYRQLLDEFINDF